jgi:hypothetical protein
MAIAAICIPGCTRNVAQPVPKPPPPYTPPAP